MVGAGIGGLAAALPLVHAGADVTVVDRLPAPGGKMRQINGVDAGPTVLTLRHVFDQLFDDVNEVLDHHVRLIPQDILARHWWPGSEPLDLYADAGQSEAAIEALCGSKAARQFQAFHRNTANLFTAFRAPMMEAANPRVPDLARVVLSNPGLIPKMAPLSSLAGLLSRRFDDPRLQQLFGRYATYVGGSPYQSPALLSLIWQAEAGGVWCVDGGMHSLARAIAQLIEAKGGRLRLGEDVARILTDSDGISGVVLKTGEVLPAQSVVFNGDPRALATGLLGHEVDHIAPKTAKAGRSLSATVWSFRAKSQGPDLVHHNVFFCANPRMEFTDIAKGRLPRDATLYLCAEDRGQGRAVEGEERFEIIRNAPPLTGRAATDEDYNTCHDLTFPKLRDFGLGFSPTPGPDSLTMPQDFNRLFPGSDGSLYGQTPHGMTAALDRPQATTAVPGLVLCGGGCHPGAGVPMSALSGRHAAAAIMKGRTSTLTSRRTVTPGGTSMASATVERAPSRSLPS